MEFSELFRRVLSLSLDASISWTIRTTCVLFILYAFQSLDCGIVRKECAPLVSIGSWHNLSTDAKRDELLDGNPQLKKAWRAAIKRFDAADEGTSARLRFDRSWLYTAVLDFLTLLHSESLKQGLHSHPFSLNRTYGLQNKCFTAKDLWNSSSTS